MRMLSVLVVLALAVPVLADEAADAPARIPDVNVTATRTPNEVETLTGAAETLDRDDLDLIGAGTLEEAIRDLAGVDVVGNGRYGEEVRFNTRGLNSGFGTQRTLILLDGRPLTDEYTGHVDTAQYPLAAMRRVEMVLGPASALYGTNALGGVVNLIPRRGGEVPFTEVSGQLGSHGTVAGALTHASMIGPVDFSFTVTGSDTDGYLRNSMGDRMDWETRSGFANVGWSTDRLDVRAYLSIFHGEGTDENFDRDIDRYLTDLGFTYRLDPEKDAVTTLRLYRSQLDQELGWFFLPPAGYEQVSAGAILTQTYRVHADHLLTGGVEWRREDAEVDEFAGKVDEDATTGSVFLQDEWRVAEDVRVVGGVRFDDRTNIDGEISWRLGANWRAAEGTTLRAAVGRAFRAPTISDQYLPETAFFGMTFAGNPDLGPEVLYSAEIGVDQQVVPGLNVSLTGFATQAEDFWDFLPAGDGILRPQNIAKVRIYGVEIRTAADLEEFVTALAGVTAEATYTFTDATYEEFTGRPDAEGNRLDDNVRHRGSLAIVWRHVDGHAARLALLVSGDRYTDETNSAGGHLPGYHVLALSAEAAVMENVRVTLSAENVLNRGYRTRPEFREPPRGIFGGFRLTF